MNVPFLSHSTPVVQPLLERQQAYTQQQELIQASQFAGQDQQAPQQQQQLQQQQVEDFMAELDMVTLQPEGLAMYGNMWDDMFWPLPLGGSDGAS